MKLFEIDDYRLPPFEFIDWLRTKEAVGIFIQTMKINRERMGLTIYPQLTSGCLLSNKIDPIKEKEQQGLSLSEYEKEYLKTEAYFTHAFAAIMHPYRPEITERRRRVFFYRYFYGLSVIAVSERINYQKNIIIDDSKMAMAQFALALDLLFYK
ncbi:transcriptional regulator, ArpU family protein [Enterococcus faecalis]|uniref:transcriptional regulator, ArpU family protein n=1 Tax=Enterococcus faecalis TaxID=1351 RepID=UPI0025B0E445|nr:transcriptional regulator, ArpU family protein [Enterococcus faecalis]MDN3202073.1 transcriptional regulator, ArpU family protein [Enterococcus faecalis]